MELGERPKGRCHVATMYAETGCYYTCSQWEKWEPWTAERLAAERAKMRLGGHKWVRFAFGARPDFTSPSAYMNLDNYEIGERERDYRLCEADQFLDFLNLYHLPLAKRPYAS